MTTIERQQHQLRATHIIARAMAISTILGFSQKPSSHTHTHKHPGRETNIDYRVHFSSSSQQYGTLHALNCPYLARLSLVAFTFPSKFTRSHIKCAITRAHFARTHQHKWPAHTHTPTQPPILVHTHIRKGGWAWVWPALSHVSLVIFVYLVSRWPFRFDSMMGRERASMQLTLENASMRTFRSSFIRIECIRIMVASSATHSGRNRTQPSRIQQMQNGFCWLKIQCNFHAHLAYAARWECNALRETVINVLIIVRYNKYINGRGGAFLLFFSLPRFSRSFAVMRVHSCVISRSAYPPLLRATKGK